MSYIKSYEAGELDKDQLLPFRVRFNFKKMFDYWEALAKSDDPGEAAYGQSVLAQLQEAPELRGVFDDPAIIERHEKQMRLLVSPLFPPLVSQNEIKAVTMPMVPIFFNMTKRMEKILENADKKVKSLVRMPDSDTLYIYACSFILNWKYKANIGVNRSLFFDIADKRTGVRRHYRAFTNADFVEFRRKEGIEPPTEEQIQMLKDNFEDIALWKKIFPPNSYECDGFALSILFDVTKEEALSALKNDLLKKDALHSPKVIDRIRENIGSMLNLPDLELGFAAYDKERKLLKSLGFANGNSLALGEMEIKSCNEAFCSRSNELIFDEGKPFILADVRPELAEFSPIIGRLVNKGIKSYIGLPLIYNGKILGLLELASRQKKQLNSAIASVVQDILPLFTTAIQRSQEEMETRLEAIIQEKATAIHPTVSWRFFEAAERFLQRKDVDEGDTLEDITFPEVYPLYGQSDIKGSSTERNNAIQADTIEQLRLAKKVLDAALKRYRLPIYEELRFRINKYIKKFRRGLNAGDEITVLEFLKREIYPAFNHLETLNPEMKQVVQDYSQRLDPDLGVVYRKRRDYEETVQTINNKIGLYLEQAQERAQQMFPHYFEKYKTDGVEHNMYIGQSMVKNRRYDPLYLQNLRLWQLMVICEIENLMRRSMTDFKIPLEIASLILVHSNPITIKFRMEEKRFDVEGSYNIRYEIMKKRIDKALIKGSKERLTQAGKIAIVYSQEREAAEYQYYLEYLQSINYIGPNIEWLELSDLQGVTGLKAIRVDVVFNNAEVAAKSSEMVAAVGS